MNAIINNKNIIIENHEFNTSINNEFYNLRIINDLAYYDKLQSLIDQLKSFSNNFISNDTTHGYYLSYIIKDIIENVYILCEKNDRKVNDINQIFEYDYKVEKENFIIFMNKYSELLYNNKNSITISTFKIINDTRKCFLWNDMYIYVPKFYIEKFNEIFIYDINNDNLLYDNLLEIAIMVKNGGEEFRKMLRENLNYFDRFTILDTGSTDNTIDIIKEELVGKKRGNLYTENFINFRDSRNRCLDLCSKKCKFTIMLDDTYIIKGDLRKFLNTIRGDQFADSFSMYIVSDDVEYCSNRIIKSDKNLRYIFKIHEVLNPENNINVCIPKNSAYIYDYKTENMNNRTLSRKMYDLDILFQEYKDDPNQPRHLYYIAQTYNLLENHEKAFEFFKKRVEHENKGFLEEKVDASFELARLANFKLNYSWDDCIDLYMKSYELDKRRPEPYYFIGIGYLFREQKEKAFNYIKLAFELNYPDTQYSMKPTLCFHFIPKFLAQLSFEFNDYKTGLESCERYLNSYINRKDDMDYETIKSWYSIFRILLLNSENKLSLNYNNYNKDLFVIIADGGFNKWNGYDILNKGVGGSETFVIEIASYIKNFQVILFCNTEKEHVYKNVIYKPLDHMFDFFNKNYVFHVLLSRFSEYLPYLYNCKNIENVHFIIHDIYPSGNIIIRNQKLKNIICLSESHKSKFINKYNQMNDITSHFYYGIDINSFTQEIKDIKKIKNCFIYSSFPNRGLIILLELWEKIKFILPDATLIIHSDIDGKWVNSNYPDMMIKIKDKLNYLLTINNIGIIYKGWTSKSELYKSWAKSEYFLYPCIFEETFCLTALEAALSKTLVICNNLGSLNNIVDDRGIIIKGDPYTEEWKREVIQTLLYINENRDIYDNYIDNNFIWANKLSWKDRSSLFENEYLLKNFIKKMGMYSWCDNIYPEESSKKFYSILDQFNKQYKLDSQRRILEIGVYTGNSFINILKNIDNSVGTAIDLWEDYNEKDINDNNIEILNSMGVNNIQSIFIENIKNSKLLNRTKYYKGKSFDILLELLKKNQKFDLIYIDGSHKSFDCLLDCFLSWQLLEFGGLFIIDDYHYKINSEDILDRPKESIDFFLKNIEGQYRIIYKSYRIFIEKNQVKYKNL